MGWFSDTFNFETLAPIAAGIILPGWGGVLAGSAIGAATSDDPLTGALTGGIGAYGGQGLASSFAPNGIASLFSSTPAATTAATTAATGANLGGTAAAPIRSVAAGEIANTGISTGINPSFAGGNLTANTFQQGLNFADNFGPEATNQFVGGLSGGLNPTANAASNSASAIKNPSFMEGLSDYGGGGKYGTLKGAGKLGFMGAGIMASGGGFDQEPMEFETPDEYKYDPTRQLNLGDDVDSGLRLIAKGGYIGNNYATGGYLEGGGIPEATSVTETETMSTGPDGMSDSIAATIDQEQPAALSEGEFVVPADVVAFAGNGSSEAGAQRFYKMLGDIREASTGQREQIKEIDVEEYMPMGGGIGKLA
jgi:hypothetical protein